MNQHNEQTTEQRIKNEIRDKLNNKIKRKFELINELIKDLRELEELLRAESERVRREGNLTDQINTARSREIKIDIDYTKRALVNIGEEVTVLKRQLYEVISSGPVIRITAEEFNQILEDNV